MKGLKGLALAMVAILLCVTTIVAGTFALFSDTVKVTNHLQSGTLDVTLERVSATKTILSPDGYLTEVTVGSEDFSDANTDNLFGLETGDKIVPGSVLNANMTIKNDSTVAFGYYVKVVLSSADGKVSDQTLASQLKVTVTGDRTVSTKLSEGVFVGGENDFIAKVGVGEQKTFSVKVEFVNDSIDTTVDNNEAMAKNVYVDFIVYAVQQLSK